MLRDIKIISFHAVFCEKSKHCKILSIVVIIIIMSVQKPTLEIPVIDISGFLRGDEDAKKACALELRSALENVGFFQIRGHSVSADLQKRFIRGIADFFALPQPEKDKIGQDKSPCNRGYEAIGVERLEEIEDNSQIEKKEGFTVRCERPLGRFMTGPNQWPDPSLPGMSNFRETYMEYYAAMHRLSTSMFRLMALSLDLDEDFFDAFAADPDGEFPFSFFTFRSLSLSLSHTHSLSLSLCVCL